MLQISHLTKHYGSLLALDDLTFDVKQGEIMGFVGSNGAGKSTTMRIALGVVKPDYGKVFWKGKHLGFRARQRIGYMPEERGLYPKMRVGELLVYLARLHGVKRADAFAAMRHWTRVLNLHERRHDEVNKLSLGNQQRVQLAAALVHDPELLVLDEPFSGLDPLAVNVMSEVLKERAQAGVTTIFSSHQLDLVERLCDRVTIISHGRLITTGTLAELRESSKQQYLIRTPHPKFDKPAAQRLRGIAGVQSVQESRDEDGTFLLMTFAEGLRPNPARLLGVVQSAVPVNEFSRFRPPLSQVYANVVAQKQNEMARKKIKRKVRRPSGKWGTI